MATTAKIKVTSPPIVSPPPAYVTAGPSFYALADYILDDNGNWWQAQTPGLATGSADFTDPPTTGVSVVIDGEVTWLCVYDQDTGNVAAIVAGSGQVSVALAIANGGMADVTVMAINRLENPGAAGPLASNMQQVLAPVNPGTPPSLVIPAGETVTVGWLEAYSCSGPMPTPVSPIDIVLVLDDGTNITPTLDANTTNLVQAIPVGVTAQTDPYTINQ